MEFLLVLGCVVVFCGVFRKAIYKAPGVFYALCIILAAMYAVIAYVDYPYWLQRLLFILMQKGTLATALFVVVMYIGVLKGVPAIANRYMPVRATISIMACFLICGHMAKYMAVYVMNLGVLPPRLLAGLIVALVLLILLIVLGVTSFAVVKRKLGLKNWQKVQKWAYLFYALIYLHVFLLLYPSAVAAPGGTAAESLLIYTVIFGLYAVLRVGKAMKDAKRAKAKDTEEMPEL